MCGDAVRGLGHVGTDFERSSHEFRIIKSRRLNRVELTDFDEWGPEKACSGLLVSSADGYISKRKTAGSAAAKSEGCLNDALRRGRRP